MPKQSPEEALQECLATIREFCGDIEFPDEILDDLAKRARPKFENPANHEKWESKRELVLMSASFLGKIAGHLAQDDKVQKVERNHAEGALKMVKDVCTARRDPGVDVFIRWCP